MKTLCQIIAAIAIALLGAVILVEWAVGCGETYIDHQGVRHEHGCVFIR